MVYTSYSLFIFHLRGDCHCWRTNESRRAHIARFHGWLLLIRSVFRASKFSVLKLLEIEFCWVYNTIPFGYSLFRHFRDIICNFWNRFVWLRITDEVSLSEMRIWSILLINSELKWCKHLSRSLFWYYIGFDQFLLPITGFKDDSAYVATKTAVRNQRITEDG